MLFSGALVLDRHVRGKGLQTLGVRPAVENDFRGRGEEKHRQGQNSHAD